MLLGACSPAVPVVEEPVVEAPAPVVVVEEPVDLDLTQNFSDFWASVPADKGYGSVKQLL
ncbi:MAG: hypothetical protein HC806_09070 [Anaerolineae bacterium]|nr:hypothetical protein [Anaerolineae bacterium]